MHHTIRTVTRLGELSAAMLVGVLLTSGATEPVVVTAPVETASVDSLAVAAPLELMTALDSMEAERELAPAAMRRPLETYLRRYSDDRVLVRRISRAVLREASRQQVPPSLITAVLLTENTTLRPEAASSVGAQGLMQVMPFHAGARLCKSDDLVDVDSNICHGTLILARNLQATTTPVAALLRYNGCVRGTNTPNCGRYPSIVLARASRVRHEILAAAMPVELAGR
ncbi:MAG TPA: transglycosylase SLT domain-containing protein [Gemmatimonadales bacterium]|nr:transglycosylase SLT domain-containing protein [Gemmatimonadales bacterium]